MLTEIKLKDVFSEEKVKEIEAALTSVLLEKEREVIRDFPNYPLLPEVKEMIVSGNCEVKIYSLKVIWNPRKISEKHLTSP